MIFSLPLLTNDSKATVSVLYCEKLFCQPERPWKSWTTTSASLPKSTTATVRDTMTTHNVTSVTQNRGSLVRPSTSRGDTLRAKMTLVF